MATNNPFDVSGGGGGGGCCCLGVGVWNFSGGFLGSEFQCAPCAALCVFVSCFVFLIASLCGTKLLFFVLLLWKRMILRCVHTNPQTESSLDI